ncbi:hypothetical protein ANCDUO_02200 [Ancylostoma duodenale]|uniref:Uncharacterized protein n=1 Tax=Ancylostoma duodenale TaxID=51022 RepID=A0A0C2H146_9BILA|nr:hypothetical protein ANCDUO_02200 [Ancylostoma duodenale]
MNVETALERSVNLRRSFKANNLCTIIGVTVETIIARILDENGYDTAPATAWLPHSTEDGLPLILLYVGDRPARHVNQVVRHSGLSIRLVPLTTYLEALLDLSQRNTKTNAQKLGAGIVSMQNFASCRSVYLIKCHSWGKNTW